MRIWWIYSHCYAVLVFVFYKSGEWSELQAFSADSRCHTEIGLEQATGAGCCASGASECRSRNVGALVRACECNLRPCSAVRGTWVPFALLALQVQLACTMEAVVNDGCLLVWEGFAGMLVQAVQPGMA